MPSDLSATFGKLLRDKRRDRRLTQEAAAKAAGLTRTKVLRIEKGENVGIDDVHRLALALGFTLTLTESVRPTWENAREFFFPDES